uniref:J domain-containing protein n=1 Tax=Physcomitrium patens TaxID=3218 RepID=A0A7I4ELD9_PHYPA
MEEQEDLYAVFRLQESGPQVQNADIRKAYRKRALELHPDKRGDDPGAAVEFQKLQKAYEILNDERARASYDELLRVRKERVDKESKQSEKRQKMMRTLAEKEKAYDREQKVKLEEDYVQKQLKEQIASINKAHGRKSVARSYFDLGTSSGLHAPQIRKETPAFDMRNSAGLNRHQFKEPSFAAPEIPISNSNSEATEAERTLKVSWTCLEGGAGDYSAAQLEKIFQEFGFSDRKCLWRILQSFVGFALASKDMIFTLQIGVTFWHACRHVPGSDHSN